MLDLSFVAAVDPSAGHGGTPLVCLDDAPWTWKGTTAPVYENVFDDLDTTPVEYHYNEVSAPLLCAENWAAISGPFSCDDTILRSIYSLSLSLCPSL
jgi:hypothetical protein